MADVTSQAATLLFVLTLRGAAPAPSPRGVITAAWPAPVGHFQPRASDIPLSPGVAEQEARDQALDEKLKICRGC